MCLSNPSFELWFLLHYQYSVSRITNIALITKLRNHLPNYNKSTDYFDDLLPNREEANKRAKRLNDFHERNSTELNSTQSNPSTQVYKIVEEIQSFNS